ncbi:MAG TPA: hypothetical protein VGO57_08255 [Verrucomicrobiae bacterium]|jgi:hypothetical protein
MKIFYKLLIVILVLFLELAVVELGLVFGMSHGLMADVPYRHAERVAAFQDSIAHPSPAAEAVFQAEVRLMHRHEDWKWELPAGLFIVINGIGIYYFFRRGRKLTTVKTG